MKIVLIRLQKETFYHLHLIMTRVICELELSIFIVEKPVGSAMPSQTSNSVLAGLASEVTDFEQELAAFINEASDVESIVSQLGEEKHKVAMAEVGATNICNLYSFNCMRDLHFFILFAIFILLSRESELYVLLYF